MATARWDEEDPGLKSIAENAKRIDASHFRRCASCHHHHAPDQPCGANLFGPEGRGCPCTR